MENSNIFSKNVNNKKLIRYSFGWNFRCWATPFAKLDCFESPQKINRILELGASSSSIVSLSFDGLADEIIVSYYDENQRMGIEKHLMKVRLNYELKSHYKLEKIDAHLVEGDFDIVVMKSVLGGLFRQNDSSMADVDEFLNGLRARALSRGGSLISIDNGKSIFERFLSNFGARKNHWRFFDNHEFRAVSESIVFGCISSFSFETRFGALGYFLDNCIIYPVDLFLSAIFPNSPTVIVSVFPRISLVIESTME